MDYKEIEKIFDYKFKNEYLLHEAFLYNELLIKYGDNSFGLPNSPFKYFSTNIPWKVPYDGKW